MKKFLITGVTGTMGRALTKCILEKIPNAFVLGISRDEQKQRSLPKYDRLELKIADIRNKDSLLRAIKHSPIIDCVFHLAALKCVDTLEDNVSEAIETNVLGTRNIVDFCTEVGSDLVMASTDKACYPVNAYGATKALAERLVTSAGFKVCRYGNVIGSRGSFVPHIVHCLKAGKPIPITHNEMTRYWLKIEEVAQFLLDASALDLESEILLPPNMFSSHVVVLVQAIAEILGVESYTLETTGIRPGEKLHETLQTKEEGGLVTSETSLCRYNELVDYLKGVVK